MEENIKICLNEIQIKDLNNNTLLIDDLAITIGNIVFRQAETIEVNDIARLLHKGEAVEINENELKEILFILENNRYFKMWIHQQILEYFTEKLPKQDGAE